MKVERVTKMNQLKIKDNSHIDKSHFQCISGLVNRVADKTIEKLTQEGIFVFPEVLSSSDDISKEQMILQTTNECFCSGNIMGFIGYGKDQLLIESRFSCNENDFLFHYLLNKVIDLPNIADMKSNSVHSEWFFNILLFMFPGYLKAAMCKGLFKTYFREKYNDSNVKGVIDIPRHISNNTPFVGNIAYSQREYSTDNYMTELIRHTIEFIKSKSYGNLIVGKAKDEIKLIISATEKYKIQDRKRIISQNNKNIIRHAYYHEYRALQRLCLLILQHQSHSVGFEAQQIYGVLFDGAWLWEEYINNLISDWFYHPMNKAGKNAQYLFAGSKGRIYPDFISKDSVNRVIADAKYKHFDNIGNKDYLQVLAYMFRFDAKAGLYLYPEISRNNDDSCWLLNRGSSFEKNVEPRNDVSVSKIGFRIPEKAASYSEFSEIMAEREDDFIARVQNILSLKKAEKSAQMNIFTI